MKCNYCEVNVTLPFKCPFCGKYFCADHRLPENHACEELWRVKLRPAPPAERSLLYGVEDKAKTPPQRTVEYPFRVPRDGWTSKTEIYHLTVGALAVTAVGLSLSGMSWLFQIIMNPMMIFGSALIFMFVFVSHELAHKVSAKYFGMWAEFRLSILGLALTALSILSPLIKIISPGAVMIAGVADRKTMGKIALAGPLTNMIFAFLFYVMAFQVHIRSLVLIFSRGAAIGAWMAMFNLIPLGIFDGAKVIWWSKPVWAMSFLASIAISLVTIFVR